MFYFGTDTDDFSIFLSNGTDGFTGFTGLYAYDPFGPNNALSNSGLAASIANGVWQNAPAGGVYAGALAWGGVAQTVELAEVAASALGQVYVIPSLHRIIYIDVFAAQEVGYGIYRQQRLVPPYFNNPTLVTWGRAQASRLPVTDVANIATTDLLEVTHNFFRWKLDASELYFGASADQIEFLSEVEAEALTNPDALPPDGSRADVFYKLKAGIWSGTITVQSSEYSLRTIHNGTCESREYI